MQAIQLTQHGSPAVLSLSETEKPVCQPEEVFIRVDAIGLNYVDTLIRRGVYPLAQPLPVIMPGEVEGVIEAIGSAVAGFHPGQRVTAYCKAGYAQYATAPVSQVTAIPDDLPLGQGMLIQTLSAQNLFHQATAYRSVIVTAAGGGVGSIAIQLAKIKGAETIIGLTGSMQKADLIHSLGATAVIDYRSDNWLDQLDALTKKKGADLILESVGGDIGSALFTRLAPGGTMVVYGFSSGKLASIDMQSLVMSATRVVGARLITASEAQKQQWANELVQWIRTGQLKTPITSYSLADVAQAHADMENRSTTGRVIVLTRVTI